METKGVKICEYCSKVIDPQGIFIQDIEREGNQINHEADYHQECFINSMIKDLEVLGFEVIRPRTEINKNLKRGDDHFDLNPKEIKAAMDIATPMLDALFSGSKNKISPDFIGDDPETMKEGTITPIPKTTVPKTTVQKRTIKSNNNQNGEKKEQKKPTVTRKGK